MTEITVRWNQRVAGRFPGYMETAEETPFLLGCLANNRCELVPVIPALPALAEPAVELNFEAEVQAAMMAPVAKRAPRRPRPAATLNVETEVQDGSPRTE
jgi:hypothetical protein